MLSIVLALVFAAAPNVGQFTSDVRAGNFANSSHGTGVHLVGDGFTDATFRSYAPITVNNGNILTEAAAALAGPTIDWASTGANTTPTVYSDGIALAVLSSSRIEFNSNSYCVPFIMRNGDGDSPTYVLNKPKIYGLPGANPAAITPGQFIAITGRHLRATVSAVTNGSSIRVDPVVLVIDGEGSIVQTLNNISLPGGFSNHPVNMDRAVLWAKIPTNLAAGNYSLAVFTGENRWGLSNLVPITVVAPVAPAMVPVPITLVSPVQLLNGADITGFLSTIPATSSRVIYQLPPGVFYLTRPIDWPANVGIQGAGMHQTILKAHPTQFVADGSKLVISRESLIRIAGNNTSFADLTIEMTPNVGRTCIATAARDSATFERVRFFQKDADQYNAGGYPFGFLYRYGLCRYWSFVGCLFECQQFAESGNFPANQFSSAGDFDALLIRDSIARPPNSSCSWCTFGVMLGRGSLIHNVDFSAMRKAMSVSPGGFFPLETVISCCTFHDMISDVGNGECFSFDVQGGEFKTVASGTSSTVVVTGDTTNRARWTAAIASGTGFGQYRVIASTNTGTGTHTLETAWGVPPDNTSKVVFSQAFTDCTLVNNRFSDCVGGINLFGTVFGCSINSNWVKGSHEGIMANAHAGTSDTNQTLIWWTTARENTFEDGCGFHFRTFRPLASQSTYTHPSIAFVSTSQTQAYGTVTNQLWASSSASDIFQASASDTENSIVNLIDYVSTRCERGYSGKTKYQSPVIDIRTEQTFWWKVPTGVAHVDSAGFWWDDATASTPIVTSPAE